MTSGGGLPDLDGIERLVAAMGGWLSTFAKRSRQTILAVAALSSLAGFAGLTVGLIAWHDSAARTVVVAIICVPAALAPFVVSRRIRPLTDAVAQPDEVARQARTYFAGLPSTTELNDLVGLVVQSDSSGQSGTGRRMKLRTLFKASRMVGDVVERAKPDPITMPLLSAFQPTRLRGIWFSMMLSVWLWMLASLVAVIAGMALVVRALS